MNSRGSSVIPRGIPVLHIFSVEVRVETEGTQCDPVSVTVATLPTTTELLELVRIRKNSGVSVAPSQPQEQQGFEMATDGISFRCPKCPKKWNTAYMLRRHMKIHSEKYKCPVEGCAASYGNKTSLTKHRMSAHGIPKKGAKKREPEWKKMMKKIQAEMDFWKGSEGAASDDSQ